MLRRKIFAFPLVASGLLVGCFNSNADQSAGDKCEARTGELFYTNHFAEIYGLPAESAIELSDGLLAVRMYWTEYVHARGRPYLQVQIYIDSKLGASLDKAEGTLAHYESYVQSGFEYFPAEPTLRVDPQRQNQEFYNRLILHSAESGTKTEAINRYKVELAPGVTAIEFSTAFYPPFDVYLYNDKNPGVQHIDPLFFALSRDENPERHLGKFVHMQIPRGSEDLRASECAPH